MVQKELLFILFSQHWSIRKISRSNNIHRKTVNRYYQEWVQLNQSPPALVLNDDATLPSPDSAISAAQIVPPGEKQLPTEGVVHFQVPPDPDQQLINIACRSKAFHFHEHIYQKLNAGQTARSIFQDLVIESGYTGSYDCIKRYVRKLRKRSPKLYARLETPPGEEAQVDFGLGAPTLYQGRYKKPWLFVMTLSYSRKSYQEVVWRQDVETFILCHENAFRFFGGVPKTIKLDTLKSAVLRAHLYEPELNPNYLALAQHYHFAPLPCKIKSPQQKGKVENNINYVQDNALTGKRFDCLEAQNQYLRHWNKTWASTRIHGTTKRQVNLMFDEEKVSLQPLPAESLVLFKIGTRKVNMVDSHIEVNGAYYPIPPRYMGQQVTVHFNSQWVKVFYQQALIQCLSTVAKGSFHPDHSCLPANKNFSQDKYIQYLFRRCAEIGPAVTKWARLAEQQRQQRAYRSIQGIVALTKKYPEAIINQACQQSIDHHAVSYHVVKSVIDQLQSQQQLQIEIQFTQQADVIRSPLEYQQLLLTEVTHG